MRNALVITALAATLALACSKKPAGAESTPASSSPTGAPTINSASAGDAERPIRALVEKWNHALAARDAEALSTLYGANVELYGSTRTREAVIRGKKKAFTASPDYTQSIGAITLERLDTDSPQAHFEKRWTEHARSKATEAVLTFKKDNGEWTIAGETDQPSIERTKNATTTAKVALPKVDACTRALDELVSSTPGVKKLLDGPKNPAAGHTTNVLEDDGDGEGSRQLPARMYRVVEEHGDHRVTIGTFDFAGHAVLQDDVTDPAAEGKPLKFVEKKARAAELACPDKFWD